MSQVDDKIADKASRSELEPIKQSADEAKAAADEAKQITEGFKSELDHKAPIDSPTFTGVPQVAVSPDDNDSSQRIPSTNWVNKRIEEEVAKVSTDGFYTREQVDALLKQKADLIDGKVPESQLPKLYIIEVE